MVMNTLFNYPNRNKLEKGMTEEFNECDLQRIIEQSKKPLPEKKCKECGTTLTFNPIRFYNAWGCNECGC